MELIPQYRPEFGFEEKLALNNYISEDVFFTEFKVTQEFEKKISNFTGCKHSSVVSNGTIALTIAGLALDLTYNDEIICPNFTMIASYNAFKLIGCSVKLVDVEYPSLWICEDSLEKAITPKTKAVVFVSANGRHPSYDVKSLYEKLKSRGIAVIEDCAQALGSNYRTGEHLGNCADIFTLSFSPPKIISTGQGGAVCTNNHTIGKNIKKIKDFGRAIGGHDVHDQFGINAKFTDIQATIGLCQFEKLEYRISRKKTMFSTLKNNLQNSKILLLPNNLDTTVPWFFEILSNKKSDLKAHLKNYGFSSRDMYPPLHSQAFINQNGYFPISERIGREGLWIPCWPGIKDNDFKILINCLNKF